MSVGHRILGLALAFLNTALSSTGFVLQRKAHLVGDSSSKTLSLIGVGLYIAAALPDVWAYTLIPQMLCATVACFRLVVVCVMGHVFLGEHLGRRDARSIAICTSGTILCVMFGPSGDVTPDENRQRHQGKVVAYSIVGLLVLGVFLVIAHADSLGWVLASSKLYRFSLPIATALAYAVEKVFNTELGFVEKPQNIFLEPTWLCMVGMVALLGLTDFYLNMRAAGRMPVHMFVPLSFAFATSFQCFQAMVIFDEFADMSVFCCVMTSLGAGLALAGALLIQPRQLESRDTVHRSPSQAQFSPKSKPIKVAEEGRGAKSWAVCPQRAQKVWMRHLKKRSSSQELHLV